jgi:hypothetical protein
MTIYFEKLSKVFNALRDQGVNKSPVLFYAFDHGRLNVGYVTQPRLLDIVIRNGSHAHVNLLLKAGANPNLTTHFSGPATNEAVRTGDMSMVDLIVKGGGDVNMPNKAGSMSLHEAVSYHDTAVSVQMIDYLLEKGARLDMKNSLGMTPAEWARQLGKPEALARLDAAAQIRAAALKNAAPKPPRA